MDAAGARLLGAVPPAPVKLWVQVNCGGCGQQFTADPATVPCFKRPGAPNAPTCRGCWDRRNLLREAIGETAQDRPKCYPSDYEEA